MKQHGLFDSDKRLKRVGDLGDSLEVMNNIIDFSIKAIVADGSTREPVAAVACCRDGTVSL
ncbi:MAG: hypothetical protein GDA39_10470 [Hyphomonadaceae bacterium]|nr:hypothetical protein [Hyphomonadaceae bacterium]MBC6413247.1 hypothetical protein [Hyphomonadaceae bacterium]